MFSKKQQELTKEDLWYILDEDLNDFEKIIISRCYCGHCETDYLSTIINYKIFLNDLNDVISESELLTSFALTAQDLFGIRLPNIIPEMKVFKEPVSKLEQPRINIKYTGGRRHHSHSCPLIDLSRTSEGPINTEPVDPDKLLEELKMALAESKGIQVIKRRRH